MWLLNWVWVPKWIEAQPHKMWLPDWVGVLKWICAQPHCDVTGIPVTHVITILSRRPKMDRCSATQNVNDTMVNCSMKSITANTRLSQVDISSIALTYPVATWATGGALSEQFTVWIFAYFCTYDAGLNKKSKKTILKIDWDVSPLLCSRVGMKESSQV